MLLPSHAIQSTHRIIWQVHFTWCCCYFFSFFQYICQMNRIIDFSSSCVHNRTYTAHASPFKMRLIEFVKCRNRFTIYVPTTEQQQHQKNRNKVKAYIHSFPRIKCNLINKKSILLELGKKGIWWMCTFLFWSIRPDIEIPIEFEQEREKWMEG